MRQQRLKFTQARLDFTRFADVATTASSVFNPLPLTQRTAESFREFLPDAMSFFATPTAPGFPRVSFNGAFTNAAAF
jgi:hypothetical protein